MMIALAAALTVLQAVAASAAATAPVDRCAPGAFLDDTYRLTPAFANQTLGAPSMIHDPRWADREAPGQGI